MKWSKEKRLILILSFMLLIILGVGISILLHRNQQEESASPLSGNQYDVNVVVDDPVTLQQRVDEMVAKAAQGQMTLEMEVSASSQDGKNFTCYLSNALENSYDMYMIITLDETQEELCRTGLIPLGGRIEKFETNKVLKPGTYTCTLTYVQVEEDGETIHAQVNVGLDLNVTN